MESLRKPFFVAALILIAIIVSIEIGVSFFPGITQGAAAVGELQIQDQLVRDAYEDLDPSEQRKLMAQEKPPGLAIPYLALVDGILLFTVGLMGVSLVVRERVQARLQGIVTFVFALLLVIAAIGLIFVAIAAVMTMVALLVATPFGTLIYLAVYGFFNRGGAGITLGLLMTLKIAFGVCLVLAQQRFLQNRGLVLMVLTSFVATAIVSFLHGLVPGFLASITDAIAAIIVAILAVIWAIFLLFGSLGSVGRALKFNRT
jgi:hypothetical protein